MSRIWIVIACALALVVGPIACASTPARPPRIDARPGESATRVVVATSGDYAPFSTAHGERFDGFAPAIVRSFADERGVELAWTKLTWTGLAADMKAGRFELVADGITVRPERSIAGRFTVPIARGGAVLLLRRPEWAVGATTPSALDRRELRVAVNSGAHLERVTRATFHAADIRAIPDNAAVRAALARGEVDAVMTNTFEAPHWAEGLDGIERIGPLTNDVTALWVRADREELADALDDWLLEEERSGRLGGMRAKELGPGAGPRAALAVSALSAAMAERLALMPFVAAAKQRAGLAIEDAGQEEKVLAAARAKVAEAAKAAGRSSAPPPGALDAFFRLQIEAAKAMQARVASTSAEYSLDRELRPAIARITARQARLLVRLPRGVDVREVAAQLRRDLEGLDDALVDRWAEAIVALAPR